jgi:uncharacterized protein with von Willebrand factor type A (vWA) domain
MIAALARFVDALRAERHSVSPAEVIDASRALDVIGLERRSDVKAALRMTLAKDRRAAEAFDRMFDRFFVGPRRSAKGEGAGRAAAEGARPRPGPGERTSPTRTKPKDDAKPAREPKHRRTPVARAQADVSDRWPRSGERRDGRLREVKLRPAPIDSTDPAHRDLTHRMTAADEREIARAIPRLVQALKLRVSRRDQAARRGRPWLRRALRDNLKHGGVPFVIPHRAPKRKTTRVVLLVDVSYSVARASGLFLLMAAEFLDLGRRARVLAFVDRPVDATDAVARWARGMPRTRRVVRADRPPSRGPRPGEGIASRGVAFADVLDGLRDLNLTAPSDYGSALHALYTSRLRPRGRDTVLVVLGDGRTNRFDPLAWVLNDLARGCKAVLWLAPEPRSRWGTADSALPLYAASADLLVEATDLAGLATGLADVVRRL